MNGHLHHVLYYMNLPSVSDIVSGLLTSANNSEIDRERTLEHMFTFHENSGTYFCAVYLLELCEASPASGPRDNRRRLTRQGGLLATFFLKDEIYRLRVKVE